MRFFIRLSILVLFSGVCHASQSTKAVISKESIESFLSASSQITELMRNRPELANYSGGQDIDNKDKLIDFLEQSTAYPKIDSILNSAEFSSLSGFFEFSERLMGMRLYAQMKNSKEASIFQTVDILQANLNSMKANNASESIIKQTQAVLDEQKRKAAAMRKVLDKISKIDKSFVDNNFQWLSQRISNK